MRKRTVIVWLCALAMATGFLPAGDARAEAAGQIYWTEDGEILRANLDGSDMQVLVSGLGGVSSLALDATNDKMYWADYTNSKIQRANLDGSGTEDLLTDATAIWAVALDIAANKMYWTNPSAAKIRRAGLDGTNVEDLITLEGCAVPLGCPVAIAVDPSGGKLYWTRVAQPIQRANLDGTDAEDLSTSPAVSAGIAVDSVGGKLYWTVSIPEGPGHWYQEGLIARSNLDGSGREYVVGTVGSDPGDIALDISNGKMYWADNGLHKVRRANLDGSGVEDVIARPDVSYGIAVDVEAGTPVGGIAELPGIADTPLESAGSSGMHETALLWVAAAITASTAALAGAAWYGRTRRPR
jgi:DNA-binding beta-propeller fold protein YncE